jgi:hypothetical protein
MLVVLNVLMDQKYGLPQEERREYRLPYGDPGVMVQQLLGHASGTRPRQRPRADGSCPERTSDSRERPILANICLLPASAASSIGRAADS